MNEELNDFVSKFTEEKLDGIIKINRKYFQVSKELLEFKNKIPQEPFAIGTFLGSGNPFKPSSALIDWIGERSDKFVIIDHRASWLFLCGRDVFSESIIKKNAQSGQVIIKNEENEILGYGKFDGDRKIPIKSLFDKGDFLRRER